jgi:5-formyltetrahydrofolate cyclo-ligase
MKKLTNFFDMKNQLRKKYKSLRAELTTKDIEKLSSKIYHNLISNFELESKNISIFLPIKKFKEVNTWLIIDNVKANFFLPVVKGNSLTHVKYENKEQLKLSAWGIDEPTYGETIEPKDLDLVIVPLLAYDIKGNRIGYGAGFYDDFLNDCNKNCQFIGVSFFEPEQNEIETYATDIPLDFVVTPFGVEKFV